MMDEYHVDAASKKGLEVSVVFYSVEKVFVFHKGIVFEYNFVHHVPSLPTKQKFHDYLVIRNIFCKFVAII